MSRFTAQYWKGMSFRTLPFLIITIPWALALYFMLQDRPALIERPLFWVTAIAPVCVLAWVCNRLDR